MSPIDPDQQRADSREMWGRAAAGWEQRADRIRDWGMPVSAAMVEGLALQPGERVLELAAGPGDTGFMAAELIRPGGTLVSSDGSDAMIEVARRRAAQAGIENAEFAQLELEWIDLPTASVDAVLCRWGIMLLVDPDAAAHEVRRVLRSGGRAAFAVWDTPEHNPWATIPDRVMTELGHDAPWDMDAPGMFALAEEGRLQGLLHDAGFVDVRIASVAVERRYQRVEDFIAETLDMSPRFGGVLHGLAPEQQGEVLEQVSSSVREFEADDGQVRLPGSSLVALGFA